MRIGLTTEADGRWPVCIAGMHRSGTSLVARMLNLLGLDLGDSADLMPPQPDNPEGFWEHLHFSQINESLLSEAGGDWDCPPASVEYSALPGFSKIRDQADLLLHAFEGREPWGWKDPRSSLTLGFWLTMIPNLLVVVCVRNPLEVALSLNRRNTHSYALGLTLWTIYNRRILEATQRHQRLVTSYEACLNNPRAEARRITQFLGIAATPATIENACSAGRASLRHHSFSLHDLARAGVSNAVIELYQTLCEEAAEAGLARRAPAPSDHSAAEPARLDQLP